MSDLKKYLDRRPGRKKVHIPKDEFNQICKLFQFTGFDMMAVLKPYCEDHRHFHTLKHVLNILKEIEELNDNGGFGSEIQYRSFQCAAIFHDIVYDPRKKDNEEMSTHVFMGHYAPIYKDVIDPVLVCNLIRGTAVVDDSNEDLWVRVFNRLDRAVLLSPLPGLIEYGEQIWAEYSYVSRSEFIKAHFSLIWKLLKISYGHRPDYHKQTDVFRDYEKHMKRGTMRVGLYVGSFNPFHLGHLDILLQAEKMFDKVILGSGVNPEKVTHVQKKGTFIETMPMKVIGVPSRFEQVQFNILLARYVEKLETEEGYDVTIVRGFRDEKDIASELLQRKYSLDIKHDLKYVFLTSAPGFEHISSSGIRALQRFEEDVSGYLPEQPKFNYSES